MASKAHMMDKIHSALNKELIKRMLVKYFHEKGFQEDFNKRIYPPMLQDLTILVPRLSAKLEIVPYVEDLDPFTGVTRLGWNLFVLGTQRMYLGESTHTSLAEIQASIGGPLNGGKRSIADATPKRIIKFVMETLGKSKNGDVTYMPKSTNMRAPLAMGTGEHSGYFRRSQRPVF